MNAASYLATTNAACRIAGIEPDLLNAEIARKNLTFAPPANGGRRLWPVPQVIGLVGVEIFRKAGFTMAQANRMATAIVAKLEIDEDVKEVVVTINKYGSTDVFTADQHVPVLSPDAVGTQIFRTFINVGALKEIVVRKLEEESRIID